MSQYAALIKTSSGKAVEEKGMNQLFSLLLVHDVRATEAQFKWDGPKIDPMEWAKMMAYFEWTYAEHKSESQVRWYVHPEHGWRCWAYEQEGNTGMTTKEHPLDTSPNKEQRLQFNESDGWMYFMTVHHHCSANAFQSSTDENDEKKVDGIHITIGNMDREQRHFHSRMYLQGHRFDPHLSHFWEIGNQARSQIALMQAQLETIEGFIHRKFEGVVFDEDDIAINQMCDATALRALLPTAEGQSLFQFPEIWKTNYVVQPKFQYTGGYYLGAHSPQNNGKNWCVHCGKWVEDHFSTNCPHKPKDDSSPTTTLPPQSPLTRRERRRLKQSTVGKSSGGDDSKHDVALATLHKDIVDQLAIMGYDDREVESLFAAALNSSYSDGFAILFSELMTANLEDPMRLYEEHLEQLARAELAAEVSKKPEVQEDAARQAASDWNRAATEGGWGC